jgi:hypothetical protein
MSVRSTTSGYRNLTVRQEQPAAGRCCQDRGVEPLVGVDRLIGIYDADGGLVGELRYAWGKVFADAHCSLCDLTHRGLRRRSEWDALVERLGVPFDLLHRDEMDDSLRLVSRSALPCVLVDRDAQLEVLLGPDELAACGTDLAELERRIRAALVRRTPG